MKRFIADNGSVIVLLALCAYYSVVTLSEQHPNTPVAGKEVAARILTESTGAPNVIVISRDTAQDRAFTDSVRAAIDAGGGTVLAVVNGTPSDARVALEQVGDAFEKVDAIATNHSASEWGPLKPERLKITAAKFPSLAGVNRDDGVDYYGGN